MSVTTTRPPQPGRITAAVMDAWTLTWRNLLTYIRKPDLLVFSTIQPVMFVLLFRYVFGGAFERILPPTISYVDFLMPGIFVQTAIFAALQTGDMVVIDVEARELRVELSDDEIAARLRDWTPPEPHYRSGVFAKYAHLVSSASEGAVTRPPKTA